MSCILFSALKENWIHVLTMQVSDMSFFFADDDKTTKQWRSCWMPHHTFEFNVFWLTFQTVVLFLFILDRYIFFIWSWKQQRIDNIRMFVVYLLAVVMILHFVPCHFGQSLKNSTEKAAVLPPLHCVSPVFCRSSFLYLASLFAARKCSNSRSQLCMCMLSCIYTKPERMWGKLQQTSQT